MDHFDYKFKNNFEYINDMKFLDNLQEVLNRITQNIVSIITIFCIIHSKLPVNYLCSAKDVISLIFSRLLT